MNEKRRTNINCSKCGRFMTIIFRRKDGCRMFFCKHDGTQIGEETEKWFKEMENIYKNKSKLISELSSI